MTFPFLKVTKFPNDVLFFHRISLHMYVKCYLYMEIIVFIYLFMHLADSFIQSDSVNILFVSMCVPWEMNPQPLCC